MADLVLGRSGIRAEQVKRGQQHARRAESALERVVLAERLLQRMEAAGGASLAEVWALGLR